MNQYKKKKNFLQTLFEFDWVVGATAFLMVTVAPFFVGLLVMKIPGIVSEDLESKMLFLFLGVMVY